MEKNNTITREEAAVSGIKDVYTPSHQVQGQVEAAQLYLGEYLGTDEFIVLQAPHYIKLMTYLRGQ